MLILLAALLLAAVLAARASAADSASPAAAGAASAPAAAQDELANAFGVVFISSAEDRLPGSRRTADSLEQQYRNGLATGATWNRWPLYWFNIEPSPG
ncbi:MAG TPA: hypothetical protein PLH39_03325, partial [Promineifilum sp.]|nr:hypothetical protein [Promineifilum sp.]